MAPCGVGPRGRTSSATWSTASSTTAATPTSIRGPGSRSTLTASTDTRGTNDYEGAQGHQAHHAVHRPVVLPPAGHRRKHRPRRVGGLLHTNACRVHWRRLADPARPAG